MLVEESLGYMCTGLQALLSVTLVKKVLGAHRSQFVDNALSNWMPTSKALRALPRTQTKDNIKPSLSHESLVRAVIDDDMLNRSVRMLPSNSMDSVADTSLRPSQLLPQVTSTSASWALGLEKLLADSLGLAAFMEFLKKEFSEENLEFWIACEQYKKLNSTEQRAVRGREIFDKHIACRASDPVNVDSQARNTTEQALQSADRDVFQIAQNQIFQLMKHDSYSRFIKSDIYKQCVVMEMSDQSLPYTPIEIHSESNSKTATLDRKKVKQTDSLDEKTRRKSFLPWRSKSKKTNKENDDQNKKKITKSREDSPKKGLSKQSSASSLSKKLDTEVCDMYEIRKDEEFRERLETVAQVKVILPDGSTASTVVSSGVTVRAAIRKICERKNLNIIAVDVFQLGGDKVLDLDSDISQIGAKEIVIEKRTLFRLDFPHKKSIGVKAKPNRSVADVLRPILQKYEYSLDKVAVHAMGSARPVDLSAPVSSLDNQRIIIQSQQDYEGSTLMSCDDHSYMSAS